MRVFFFSSGYFFAVLVLCPASHPDAAVPSRGPTVLGLQRPRVRDAAPVAAPGAAATGGRRAQRQDEEGATIKDGHREGAHRAGAVSQVVGERVGEGLLVQS